MGESDIFFLAHRSGRWVMDESFVWVRTPTNFFEEKRSGPENL
jgi:hypothetical protein